jgi:carbohydrate kinase (thermoresistant glucokinase family)
MMRRISMSVFVVMGVAGSGKTSVAAQLAGRTGGVWLDADVFHSPENKAKMAAGIPLTDEDRRPWLDALNATLRRHVQGDPRPLFLACSALREIYRERLAAGLPAVRFIYLKGTREILRARLEARHGHFMPAALLDSQLATLEEPAAALVADISQPLNAVVDALLPQL